MFLGIEYDEITQDSYNGVYFHIGKEKRIFNSGFPDIDILRALNSYWDSGGEEDIRFSSSVDHFAMDDEGYEWLELPLIGTWLIRKGLDFDGLKKLALPYIQQDRLNREKVRLSGITVRGPRMAPQDSPPCVW